MYLFHTLTYISNTFPKPLNSVFICDQQEAAVIRVLLKGSSPLQENSLMWYLWDRSPDKSSTETPFLLFFR